MKLPATDELIRIAGAVAVTVAVVGLAAMFFMWVRSGPLRRARSKHPLRRHPIRARTIRGGKNERPFHMLWRLRAQPLLAGGGKLTVAASSSRAHRRGHRARGGPWGDDASWATPDEGGSAPPDFEADKLTLTETLAMDHQEKPPLEDPLHEREIFASEVVSVGTVHGNIAVTLATVRFDEPSGDGAAKAHRVVAARLMLTGTAANQLLHHFRQLAAQIEAIAAAPRREATSIALRRAP
jgi:hypothetical protein